MDQKVEAASGCEYEDFEPDTFLVHEPDCDTLLVHLPDFKKERLRLLLPITRTLKIYGERILADNKWIRFLKEYPVSTNCDTNRITAKFKDEILYIRQLKLVTSSVKQDLKENPTATSNEAQKKPENDQPQGPQPQKTYETTSTTADQSKQMAEEKGGELTEDENVAKEEGKSDSVDEFGEGATRKTSERRKRGVSGSGRAAGGPGMLMNLLLGFLLAMVLGIYFRNRIKPDKE